MLPRREWALPDVDYTPYTNIISAVWPTLRHKSYTWGVIQATVNNVDRFYKSFTDIIITDHSKCTLVPLLPWLPSEINYLFNT
jgi:hypothetical protein